MPKLYEYFGLIIYFYANEHDPIHVHARKAGFESKAEIIIQNGIITEIRIVEVKGKPPLRGSDLDLLKEIVSAYSEDIVEKWIDFFVKNKEIRPIKITKRL